MKWILLLLLAAGCSSVPSYVQNGVPNLRTVAPGIMRGGQPSEQGWAFLRGAGISNVVKLNLGVDPAPLRVRYLPINLCQQLITGPSSNTIFIAVDSIKPGTFVHCSHGQDRTGLVIACWRAQREGWTRKQAEEEMLRDGFHKSLWGLYHFWKKL